MVILISVSISSLLHSVFPCPPTACVILQLPLRVTVLRKKCITKLQNPNPAPIFSLVILANFFFFFFLHNHFLFWLLWICLYFHQHVSILMTNVRSYSWNTLGNLDPNIVWIVLGIFLPLYITSHLSSLNCSCHLTALLIGLFHPLGAQISPIQVAIILLILN